ncbi:MAG TPA: hypothetical protein ENN28_04560 [Candidatus Uhrbacteria bacterium]|nr:hypothetical protein [Candidatus Uhrbacteria bacterium]
MLKNPFYYGEFYWNGKKYTGTHQPLISKDLWDNVQKRLNRYEYKKAIRFNNLPFVFKGLLTCAECGRTITAERKIKPSGKEYVYYRCTKYKRECSQKPVSEETLDKQIVEALKGLKLPDKTILYLKEALKESFDLKKNTVDKTKEDLLKAKQSLEKKLGKIYEDKLDEVITIDFYNKMFGDYTQRIEDIDNTLKKFQTADYNYYQLGANILELSKRAYFLYKNANLEEKQELLSFLLSDSQLKGETLLIKYKKPFDRVFVATKSCDYRSGRDSNPRPLP